MSRAGTPVAARRKSFPRRHPWAIAGILIALAVGGFVAWRSDQSARNAAAAANKTVKAVTVVGATALKGDIGVYLDAIGTVTPLFTDLITSQVNGLVAAVHFTEGRMVRKGDPLIDIDAAPYRATLLQAEGSLQRDENLLAQARMDLERYRAAWARNAIARQILDDQEKLVLQDEGTVKTDLGTLQFDQIQVAFCHITAPISGRVGLRLVDPGNVIQATAAATLAVITQLQPITVVFTIAEDNLGQVQAGERKISALTVEAWDSKGQSKVASGALLALDNQIDTTTGTVRARALFDNKDGALFPNQFVNTRLLVTTLQAVTLIPASAIQQNGQTSFVYVIRDNVAHRSTVKPSVTEAGLTAVDGINPDDVVANSGFDKLQDNGAVVLADGKAAVDPSGKK